jgi:hypothetical protein
VSVAGPRWHPFVVDDEQSSPCARLMVPALRECSARWHVGRHADSDVDLLVDLEPGRTLFDVAALHDDLTDLLGWSVDVVTLGALRGSLAHVADEALPV